MKLITIIQTVQIWMTMARPFSYQASDQDVAITEVRCYIHENKNLQCSNNLTIRILALRYWFFNCFNTSLPVIKRCCTGGETIKNITEPDCQEDIFEHSEETKHQRYVETCSGKRICTPHTMGNWALGNSTCRTKPTDKHLWYSNYVSITYQCVNSNNKMKPAANNLPPIVGGAVGGFVILVIIAFIVIMVVRSHRKKSEASKQYSKQEHDIPESQLNSSTTRLQMASGVQASNVDDTEAHEELPAGNSQQTSACSSQNHDRQYKPLKQDKKTNPNHKSLMTTQSKIGNNKGSREMPEYGKVTKKKKEPTSYELPTKKHVYTKVNKRITGPNLFELDTQGNTITSKDNQLAEHDYFTVESTNEENKNEQNRTDFRNSSPTYFEIQSGSADGVVHSKPDDIEYAYAYAHFIRDPSKKGTQEHDDNDDDDDDDKVEFTDNDIYNTDKVEVIDNDIII